MSSPPEFDTGLTPADLDPERPTFLETPWGPMALYSIEGAHYCIQAFCPHLEGPLFQGTLSGSTVTCPWHAWRYDLRDGERVDLTRPRSGPGCEPLVRCEVRVGERGTLTLLAPAT